MNDVFNDLETQLRRAVRSRRTTRPPWVRRGHRRTSAIVLVAMLVVTAGALAAGGVIRIGAPAEPQQSPFYALKGGGARQRHGPPAPVSTADPAGGAPWGMRVLSTKRGEGCVQVGRLLTGNWAPLDRTTPSITTGCSTSSPSTPSAASVRARCSTATAACS